MVVVRARLTGNVGMLATGQVDALHEPEAGERLEGTKDGCSTYGVTAPPAGEEHLLRGEVTAAGRHRLDHGPTRSGDAESRVSERTEDGVFGRHAPIVGVCRTRSNGRRVVGWPRGLEPLTFGATIRCSAN